MYYRCNLFAALVFFQSFPVAASTLSLVAIAADRCGAVRRGRSSLCSRPFLAVGLVWTTALILGIRIKKS